ncbi:MAG: hypothetical protein IJ849_09440 [Selenomonadaceae bacterium]|nr:hypothetical protein [Selenomonadaceae bacterium]
MAKLWDGIVTDEDYYKLTSRMSPERKKDFDEGFIRGEANFLMSLGGTGFYKPINDSEAAEGLPPREKNFEVWWDN